MIIRSLAVQLGLVGADDAEKQLGGLDETVTAAAISFAALLAGATALAVGLFEVAKGAAAAGDAVAKGADRTAIGVEEYQKLTFAFEQSGLSSAALEKTLIAQSKAMEQLAAGTGKAVAGLDELGLTQEDLAGLSADEQFALITDRLAGVTDEQDRLRIATEIYGAKVASDLMPVLAGGAEGLEEMGQLAEELGLVMSKEDTEAATKFGDTLDQVKAVVDALVRSIGLALLPVLTEWLEGMRDWFIANKDLINSGIDFFMGVIVELFDAMATGAKFAGDLMVEVFGSVENAIVAVGVAALALATGLAIWFAPVTATVAGILAPFIILALVIEDLVVFLNGGDSAIGRFIENFRESDGLIGSVARNLETLIGIGIVVFDVISQIGAIMFQVFSVTTLPLLQLAGSLFLWLNGIVGTVVGAVLEFFLGGIAAAIQFIAQSVQFVIDLITPLLDLMTGALGLAGDLVGLGGGEGGGGLAGFLTGGDETPGGVTGEAGATDGLTDSLGFTATPDELEAIPPPPMPDTAALSAGVAPMPTEVAGAAALAPAPVAGEGAGTGGTTVNVEGSTYTFDNVGLDEGAIVAIVEDVQAGQQRMIGAALEGAEV